VEYSDKQVKLHRDYWDLYGVHLSRNETIERMESAGIEPEKATGSKRISRMAELVSTIHNILENSGLIDEVPEIIELNRLISELEG